jgi:hypothetical protein
MKQRYKRDLYEMYGELVESHSERDKPCTVSSVIGRRRQPLNVLQGLLKLWPPHDLRYENEDMDDCYSTDSDLMKDLVRGMEMKIVSKDLSTNTLEVTVELQNNLAEFERFNLVVEEHNEAWEREGRPEKIFDPVHGEEHRVKDQHVDEAVIQSSYYPQPKSVYSDATGPLSKARPDLKRVSYIRVQYHLTHTEDAWTLGYVTYDPKGRVIYYNEVSNRNLTYLVRRSVQEIWGNPKEKDKSGAFLEGIPMLIQGKKLDICNKDNSRPSILPETAEIKYTNAELAAAERKYAWYRSLNTFFRYILPIILIFSMIWFNLSYCGQSYCEHRPEDIKYLLFMGVYIGGFLWTRHMAVYTIRRASEIFAEKKLI